MSASGPSSTKQSASQTTQSTTGDLSPILGKGAAFNSGTSINIKGGLKVDAEAAKAISQLFPTQNDHAASDSAGLDSILSASLFGLNRGAGGGDGGGGTTFVQSGGGNMMLYVILAAAAVLLFFLFRRR